MKKKHTACILSTAGAVAVGIILINTFLQDPGLWQIANALYVFIPILFIISTINSVTKDKALVGLLLVVPAAIVGYMASQGLLGIDHPIWTAINMWQLVMYSYLIGTRFKVLPK